MVVTVDLFGQAKSSNQEGCVWSTDAATFMEIPETPRVLADSQCYLAYTMKRRHVLRVVQRANLVRGLVKLHTKPIHAVRFVNYRSNVAASAAEGEFFVWVVTEEPGSTKEASGGAAPAADARLTVKVYFKLQDPVTIPCFSFFINAENKRPDLLVLYDTQAAILESSALIARFDAEPPDATLQRNSTTLRSLSHVVGEGSLCSVGSGGWFAFTTEPTMVAACTLQNRSTPSWACCEGEVVRALHLLDTPKEETITLLIAACEQAVYQWGLTGVAEPSLLRKFVVGGMIVSMEVSRETFAVFDDDKQLALVSMQSPSNFTCTHYALPCQVRRGGICFNCLGEGSCVLADKSDRLTVFHLKLSSHGMGEAKQHQQQNFSAAANEGAVEPVAVSKPATGGGMKVTAAPRTGNNIIANLVNQLGLQSSVENAPTANTEVVAERTTIAPAATANVGAKKTAAFSHGNRPATAGLVATSAVSTAEAPPSPGGVVDACRSPSGGDAVAVTSASTATRPALHNASLPQAPTDGMFAAAVHQSEDEVRLALERLESAMVNTSKILQLVPATIRRDHEQLLNLSLEAQMTELQKIQQQQQTEDQKQSSCAASSQMFDTYALTTVVDSLSSNIAKGVTRGIDEAMTMYLDHEVRHAIGNRVRSVQKQIIKNRLDETLKESATQFASQVGQAVQNVVKRELAEVLGNVNVSLTALVKDNSRLQHELNTIMSSGVPQEVRRMREELRTLRESLASHQAAVSSSSALHATSSFQKRRPAPETILSTALSLIQTQQQYRQGLEYMLLAQQPSLLLQLLTTISKEHESTYSDLIEDNVTPDGVWCHVLTQLVQAASEAPVTHGDVLVSIAVDVLSEREQLLVSTPQGAKLAVALRAFGQQVRAETTSAASLQYLRNLEKLLQ